MTLALWGERKQRRTMATTDSKSESAIEASLEPDQRQAFRELIDDYTAGLHSQSWRGGINPSVAAALVRRGCGGRQIRTLGIYANKETRRALATMNLTEPKKHSE